MLHNFQQESMNSLIRDYGKRQPSRLEATDEKTTGKVKEQQYFARIDTSVR
jgi:hypothetical protein